MYVRRVSAGRAPYSAIVASIATCLSIAAGRVMGDSLLWLPVVPAIVGTLLMLSEGAWMVAESHSGGEQIYKEIRKAVSELEDIKS